MAYFLKFDTVHGRSRHEFFTYTDQLEVHVQGQPPQIVEVFGERDPANIPWSKISVDYVLECTGQFLTAEKAGAHLEAGAKKVVLSAPSKDNTPMFVMGVNHQQYNGQAIVSNASCTTNCLAPIAKVLDDAFGIEAGLMTTVHAVTASQKVTDSLVDKDWRLGRAAYQNIIPASTGAAKAVGRVLPNLEGKLTGMAFRVPTQDVSVVDLTCQLKQGTDMEGICSVMREASENSLSGILGYNEEPLVSSDFIGEACTSVFDARASMSLTPTFAKIIAWYDNEWAYANKLLDLVEYLSL